MTRELRTSATILATAASLALDACGGHSRAVDTATAGGEVGNAPVASAALAGISAGFSSTLAVACARRALCTGAAAASLVAGAGAATGCSVPATGTAATGAAGAATAAVLAPGTVSLTPSLSFADGSIPLARARSAVEMWFLRAMLASVSP